jgi:nicotinamide mononucleotide adenylyltransferase
MSTCKIDASIDEIRTVVDRGRFPFSKDDLKGNIKRLNELFTIAEIPNEELRKGNHLNPDGKTARYVWVDNKKLAAQHRTTDFTKKNNKKPSQDSLNKAKLGTNLHKVAEETFKAMITTTTKFKNIDTSNIKNVRSMSDIMKDANLSEEAYANIQGSLYDIMKTFSDAQNEIDPKGKVTFFLENAMINPERDTAGTVDLIGVFSDNTHGQIDYKFKFNIKTNRGKVVDDNWMSNSLLFDYNTQSAILKDMLIKAGSKGCRFSRFIPYACTLKSTKDAKGDTVYTNEIKNIISYSTLYTQAGNEYLKPIPIGIEKVSGNEKLNKSLEEALLLKQTLIKRAENLDIHSIEYKTLQNRIGRIQRIVQDLIISKDVTNLVKEYYQLGKRYTDADYNLVNVDDEYIDGKLNKSYLTLEKLNGLSDDIIVMKSIMENANEFYHSVGLDAEAVAKFNAMINEASRRINMIDNALRQKKIDRLLTKEQFAAAMDDKELNFMDKWLRRFSEVPNTVINLTFKKIDAANTKTRLNIQDFNKKITELSKGVEEWGKANGKKGLTVYESLINKKTGNLYGKFNNEFDKYTKDLREVDSQESRDELKKIYKKVKDADAIFLKRAQQFKILKNIEDESSKEFEKWKEDNDPNNFTFNFYSKSTLFQYYEVNDAYIDNKYYNEHYLKVIKPNKALLDYYNFWTSSMKEFRAMMDLKFNYNRLPNNFIPWIKADLLEQLRTGNAGLNMESIKSIFKTQENDQIEFSDGYVTSKAAIRPDTGEQFKEIPKYFLNPLKNNNNKIDSTLKSFNLSDSLLTFANVAFNYANMKEIEVEVEALKDVLKETRVNETTSGDRLVNNDSTNKPNKLRDTTIETLLADMVDYHLYGYGIKSKNPKVAKLLMGAKRFQQIKEVGLSPMAAIANLAGARSNALFEGAKGFYYNKEQYRKANIDRYKNKELYFALANIFEPYAGKNVEHLSKKLKNGKLAKIDIGTMFAMMRAGDEHIDETIMYSMLQNYTILNGKIHRITVREREAKTHKSILETVTFDKATGEINIPSLMDSSGKIDESLYTDLRRQMLSVIANIKGSMNQEDMNHVNMSLFGSMAMTFKQWMPALIDERFRGITSDVPLRWNNNTNTITESRYSAYWSDLEDKNDNAILNFVFKIFNPSLLKLGAEIITFSKYKHQVNNDRAKMLFEQFKAKNPNNEVIQNYSFEDYLDYKEGQIRALATELRMMVTVVLALMALGGDWDDDGKADYKETLLGRNSYRQLNRVRRELMSLVDVDDLMNITRSPITQISLLNDGINLFKNTLDESLDLATGEREKRTIINPMGKTSKDRQERFYYIFKFLPGNKLLKIGEPFEDNKKSDI